MSTEGTPERRVNRREFLAWGVWAVGGLFSALLAIPLVGYVLSVLFKVPVLEWVPVCTLDQIDTTTPKEFQITFKGQHAPEAYQDVRSVFVIRRDSDILAFTNVCTHMSCSVRWLDWRDQILCPCHGGTYDRWGDLVGGPPAWSLPFYLSRIEGNVLYVANRYVKRA